MWQLSDCGTNTVVYETRLRPNDAVDDKRNENVTRYRVDGTVNKVYSFQAANENSGWFYMLQFEGCFCILIKYSLPFDTFRSLGLRVETRHLAGSLTEFDLALW